MNSSFQKPSLHLAQNVTGQLQILSETGVILLRFVTGLPMERAPVPSGKVATPLTIFNTSNGKDKERDDKGIPASPRTGKMAGILELFCVDVSRSMWCVSLPNQCAQVVLRLGQTFPYVFGKSKLKVAIDMIDRPATTEWDMQGAEHWSCLVIFARYSFRISFTELSGSLCKWSLSISTRKSRWDPF